MKQFLAGIFLGALAGFGLGFLMFTPADPAASPSAEKPEPGVTAEVTPPAEPAEAVEPTAEAELEAKSCETTLAFIRAAYDDATHEQEQNEELVAFLEELVQKSGAGSPSGNPQKFPDGLDEEYSPEGFEDAVSQLKEKCGEYFPPGTEADCSEFPCVISMVSAKHPAAGQLRDNCPLYTQLFGNSGGARASKLGKDKYMVHYVPRPEGRGVEGFMEEYQGNIDKRVKHRFEEWTVQEARDRLQEKCEGGDVDACRNLGTLLNRTNPTEAAKYLRKACSMGDASACNTLAWERCHDRGNCDREALRLAKTAVEADRSSGAIWDTLAYVLCARGDVAAANEALERACASGHEPDCGETCEE